MSNLLLTLFFDCVLGILLIITISYCAKLSHRIRLLQDNRSELATMIAQFDNATGRAMTSLNELQTVSKKITDALHLKIEKANFLADDLAFLIEKSSKLVTQLEQKKAPLKEIKSPHPQPYFETASAGIAKAKATTAADTLASQAHISSLEAVLQRLASSAASPAAAYPKPSAVTQPESEVPPAARTNAERELLKALKSSQ